MQLLAAMQYFSRRSTADADQGRHLRRSEGGECDIAPHRVSIETDHIRNLRRNIYRQWPAAEQLTAREAFWAVSLIQPLAQLPRQGGLPTFPSLHPAPSPRRSSRAPYASSSASAPLGAPRRPSAPLCALAAMT